MVGMARAAAGYDDWRRVKTEEKATNDRDGPRLPIRLSSKTLLSAKIWHLTKELFIKKKSCADYCAECPNWHSTNRSFVECFRKTLGNKFICQVFS